MTDTVVLVEGLSDLAAVETVARRLDVDLTARGVTVIAMGGATNIGHSVREHGPQGHGRRLLGLYDSAERRYFERAVLGERTTDPSALAAAGFFECDRDLEDEMIRALTPAGVERVLEQHHELESFRRFQKQPAQLDRPLDQQLRRFLGTRATRKIRYGSLLVEAVDLDRLPAPLAALAARW